MLADALDRTGCGKLLRLAPSWRGVLILNYHRIGESRNALFDRNLWSATTEDFDQQVRTIQRDFDIIPLDDLGRALRNRRSRAVMITFDDGYLDNYTEAFPVLKSHGAAATFFITTGFLDSPRVPWWDEIAWMIRTCRLAQIPANPWTGNPIDLGDPDREGAIHRVLKAYKRINGTDTDQYMSFLADVLETGRIPRPFADDLWMNWDMVREMNADGMSFGGHTVTHPILANISPEAQDYEIGECRRRLMEELGTPITAFSYPVGGKASFDRHSRELLEKHGYEWAFTYIGGLVSHREPDRFSLQRAAVELTVNRPLFRAMLSLPQVFA